MWPPPSEAQHIDLHLDIVAALRRLEALLFTLFSSALCCRGVYPAGCFNWVDPAVFDGRASIAGPMGWVVQDARLRETLSHGLREILNPLNRPPITVALDLVQSAPFCCGHSTRCAAARPVVVERLLCAILETHIDHLSCPLLQAACKPTDDVLSLFGQCLDLGTRPVPAARRCPHCHLAEPMCQACQVPPKESAADTFAVRIGQTPSDLAAGSFIATWLPTGSSASPSGENPLEAELQVQVQPDDADGGTGGQRTLTPLGLVGLEELGFPSSFQLEVFHETPSGI